MHRRTLSEAGDVPSPRSSRAASFSSDRPSVSGSITFNMPLSARPAPAYIAASVASQIVTDHHNAQLRDEGGPHADGAPDLLTNAVFSEQALNLLNGFLDNLLFAFLSTARSPSLAAIRPAITEVLKPRLAREATATADDELAGLLGGDDDDDDEFPERQLDIMRKFHVEKVWKRTRLRIMVYTRLGELEDGDEQRYVEQERGLSMDESDDDEADLVSWASAIFLTSVIEYVAEQCLLVSGQASYTRMSAKLRKAAQLSEDGELHQLERITVEDFDVEKIALNAALGRLWRTWRKRVRSTPLSPGGEPRSKRSHSSLHSRTFSYDTIDALAMASERVPELSEEFPTETEIAANIPLPMGDNDVNEIEVPSLARVFDEEDSNGTQTPTPRRQRPSSVILLASPDSFRRRSAKERPLSMPPPAAQPFTFPAQADHDGEADDEKEIEEVTETDGGEEVEEVFATPMERVDHSDDESYIFDEQQESMHHEHDEGDAESDADMVAFAASTGMGFGMSPTSPTRSDGFGREDEDTIGTPTRTGYAEAQYPKVKRLSIEKPGPPGIVRTGSIRSQRDSPAPTPAPEPKTFLEDEKEDMDDIHSPNAIGVARTSNVPIPTPSPPTERDSAEPSSSHARRKQPDSQGFVELAPRQVVTTTSAPTSVPASAPPAAPTSAPASNRPSSREQRSASQSSVEQRKESPREVVSVPRREVTPSRTRGPALSALQEADSAPSSPHGDGTPRQQIPEPQRNHSLNNSPKNYGTIRARDAPVPVQAADRPVRRPTVDGSPVARTGTGDSFGVEKATLKRVSSSSTSRSASTSILNTGRDSPGSSTRPRGLSGRMSEEDRQREFDTLVKSEDTVKFTLTPQSMREMDEPPLVVRKVDPPRPTTSSVKVYPRVSADRDNQFGSQPLPHRNNSRTSSGRGPTPSSAVGRKPLAREPRIQSESMRDFADFIRSTGPSPGEERPIQPFVSLANRATPSPNGSSTAISGLVRKVSTRQLSSHSKSNSISHENGLSPKPRIHMEPRSPAGQRSGNDDLIDFIRQGPPGANDGQHRIPRSVAPFRSTVDSDQFDRMLDDNGNIESAYGGSQVSSTVSKHSSNSRTGLLPSPSTVQPAYSNTPQKLSGSLSSPERMEPTITKTRRRVKDPYAIDLSDEDEEDLLTALPPGRQNRREEESLMDFLNSAEPPPSANEPQPLLLSGAALAKAKARAASNASGANHARQNGNGTSNRRPGPSGAMGSAGGAGGNRHKPRLQAREAGARDAQLARSATDDLADFLRTSGPPEPVGGGREGAVGRKEKEKEGGGMKKFWKRREKVEV